MAETPAPPSRHTVMTCGMVISIVATDKTRSVFSRPVGGGAFSGGQTVRPSQGNTLTSAHHSFHQGLTLFPACSRSWRSTISGDRKQLLYVSSHASQPR